ncbi:MAG: T9SS type A sorting domain-containing protein, partial [Candidatus Kapaibacteriota bacterium]
LDLRVNQLSNAAPIQSLSRLDTLRLDSNRFSFATLERLVGVPIFSYQDQQIPRITLPDTTVSFGFPLLLRTAADGVNNRYSWERNGAIFLRASSDAALRIAAFAPSDTGEYVCTVSNTELPGLTVSVLAVRVRGVAPMLPPQGKIVLRAPFQEENEVPRAPILVWTSLVGAASYTVELSDSPTFASTLLRRTLPQSVEHLTTGTVQLLTSQEQGFMLPGLTRIFWRVWSGNNRGNSDTATGIFTTSAGNPLLALTTAQFGKIALTDSAQQTLELRNISPRQIRLRSVTVRVGGVNANTPFRLRLPVQALLAPNAASPLALSVVFAPQIVEEVRGDVVLSYTTDEDTSTVQTQIFPARLLGRGSALKVISPRFDTLLVNLPRLASALVVNVGGEPLRINRLRLRSAVQPLPAGQSAETPYTLLSNEQNSVVAPGDTLPVLLRGLTQKTGALAADALVCDVQRENATPMVRDTAVSPLLSFGRLRTPNDAVMRIGVRALPPEAPPGASVRVELYIADGDLAKIRQTGTQSFRGTVQMSRQVLAVAPSSASLRQTVSVQDTDKRILRLPTTFWGGQSPILLSFAAVAVAGSVDTTALECNLQWGEDRDAESVFISEFRSGRFQAMVSRAGGKRLISTSGSKILAIAPNPAQNLVEIHYTIAESGFAALSVIDAQGREVRRLLGSVQSSGRYVQSFNVEWLPSGIYTVQMRVGEEASIHQIQIVR